MNLRKEYHRIKRLIKDLYFLCLTRKRNGQELRSLKNKHLGKRCFIIGNGPSLRMEDLDKLQDEITFGANKIYVAFPKTNWRPTYYSIQDQVMIKQDLQEITDKVEAQYKLIFGEYLLENNINLKSWIYFPLWIEKFNPSLPKFSSNMNKGMYEGMTITYTEIQMAVYMGFKEIYLLGVDFNYSGGSSGYFSSVYMNGKEAGKEYNLPNLDSSYLAYQAAEKYATQNGIKVYNATRITNLDVFERVNFDEIDL